MIAKSYTVDEIKELVKVELISVAHDNILESKSEIHYAPDKSINQGGLCMEGRVIKRRNRWFIDFRRRLIGGYIGTDELGRKFGSRAHADQYLNMMRAEVTSGAFNIDKYKKLNIQEWRLTTKFEKYIEIGCDKRGRPWAPGYKQKVSQYYNKYFEAYFKGWDLRVIGDSHIKEFFQKLPKHLALKTKKNIVDVLKSFYKSFRELDQARIAWPSPALDKRTVTWISEEEQARIISFIPEYHRPIYLFMIWHGVRPGEARALQWDCINLRENGITIKRTFSEDILRDITKGRRDRVIPIYSEFLPLFKSLKRDLRSKFVFINPKNKSGFNYGENGLTKIWNMAVEEAGYAPIRLYNGTRHSYASQLYKMGAGLSDIQELLGHSTMEMTKRYADAEQTRLTRVAELRSKNKKVVHIGSHRLTTK